MVGIAIFLFKEARLGQDSQKWMSISEMYLLKALNSLSVNSK